ncbi:hypothetical protein FAI41_06740 [Acetobacteraceae bacterium]|nr:hypothetical protein FAI41_06740 [Acetobacteraceae bacterium]
MAHFTHKQSCNSNLLTQKESHYKLFWQKRFILSALTFSILSLTDSVWAKARPIPIAEMKEADTRTISHIDVTTQDPLNVDGSSLTVGDAGKPAGNGNGYVKVAAGSSADISNGGTLTIQANPSIDSNGQITGYPTLQIGTTQGTGTASVNVNHGTINVDKGQIQVGDLAGATNDPNATGGGPATLTATDSTINGGLTIGEGGNSSATATLTNTTYNDQGNGVIVGYSGTQNSLTQNGGTSTIAGRVTVGNNAGSVGNLTFDHGAQATIGDGLIAGYGKGSTGNVKIDNGSKVAADSVYLGGGGGTGTLNVDGSSLTVGDAGKPAGNGNGYVKVAAGSSADISNGGTLTIQANPSIDSNGQITGYPTLQIGTTQGTGTASVNVNHGTINVDKGQIQVGDLAGATNDPNATGGGPATLTATDSTINGGLTIGEGGNSSATATLTNTTYNDQGNGVIVGYSGTQNSLTQNGGTSTIAGRVTVGNNAGSVGNLTFDHGAQATIGDGLIAGYGKGSTGNVKIDNGSKVAADSVYLGGGGGTGTLNVDGSSLTVGDAGKPAGNGNGYVKVAAGSSADISNGGTLTIQANPSIDSNGQITGYPTLQIGTTQGTGTASVNVNHGTINVDKGQIQVGDLAGATNDPNATGGGPATLTATDSTINGGLTIGEGGNSSATATLTNTTYNDQGNGVIVGYSGTQNSLTQNGGTSTIAGRVTVGNNAGSVGNLTFDHGAQATIGDGLIAGYGKGSTGNVKIDNGSKVAADSVYLGGGGGTGTLNVDGSSLTVGDAGKPAGNGNGYVKVAAGSSADISNGGTLTIQANPSIDSNGQITGYPTLQIGTTQGTGTASVNVNHGTINVDKGQIQVGDLAGATNDPNATGGGPATLTATDSTINGGLTIGEGGNSSATATLTNTTYNDQGNGVIVGYSGTQNSLTQNGGTSTIAGRVTVGNNAGSVGNLTFDHGAQATIGDGLIAGYGKGSTGNVKIDNGSKVAADSVYLGGGGGTGTLNVDGSSLTVGDAGKPAGNGNGYVKVAAGSSADISNGGTLTIQANPSIDSNGQITGYPTLQIGTTQGTGTASVNVNHGTINVDKGQIQVGDLAGATNDPNATGGGPATLTATDSTINGGLTIGEGGNSSATATLTNTTYNDQGNGVIVGYSGTQNSLTQNGGTSTIAGRVTVGNNAGSVGNLTFDHGAQATIGDGLIAGYGKGSTGNVKIDNGSKVAADSVYLGGGGGTGTLNVDGSSLTVGDAGKPAGNGNGYVKVAAGSSADISNGGTLTIQANPSIDSNGQITGYPTLQIGTTQGTGTASVNVNHGTINVDKGQIQVGDLAGATNDPNATGGGPATLTATDSTINGGLTIGEGGNSSATATLTNTTYNDQGNGVIVGYSGTQNSLTQNGGTSTIAGRVTVGNNAGSVGNLTFDHGAQATIGDGLIAGYGKGSTGNVKIDNGSKVAADSVYLGGGGGTGTLNVDGSSLTVGDAGKPAGNGNGYVKVAAGSSADISNGGTLTLLSQNEYHLSSSNTALPSKMSAALSPPSGTINVSGTSNAESTLAGIGIIDGNVNIRDHGAINAGFGTGTLTVNGNTTMTSDSKLITDLGSRPEVTNLYDSGTFTFQNGTSLVANVAKGAELQVNQAYDLIHADGGLVRGDNGKAKFSYDENGVIGASGANGYGVLTTTGLEYSKDDVKITLQFDAAKGLGWGGDRNQTGTAQRLSPSVDNPNSPLHGIASILAGSDNEQRLYNLTQMDGEIASDMRTGNINNNFWVRDSVNNRLDCLEDTFRQIGDGKATNSNVCGVTGKKVNVWGNMYGGLGGQNGHSGWDYAAKTRDNEAGFIWGVDGEIGSEGYAEDRWHVGMMMGYGSVMESASGVSSSGESNNANIGMYFGKQVRFDNQNFFTFHGQFGYTWNIMSWHRSVDLQGAAAQYNQSLHANELGGTAHINAEIAYKHVFNLWGTPLELAPTGSITYLNYEQGSYHETGGNLALHGAATNTNLGYGFMGAKIATNFNIGNVVITPHGKFGYRRSFGANQSYTHTGFEALGGGTDGLSIVGVPVVQDQALTELGFDVHPTEYLSFGANYVGLYGGHSQTMSGGQLSAKIAF